MVLTNPKEYDEDIAKWTKEKKEVFNKWYTENTELFLDTWNKWYGDNTTQWTQDFITWFDTIKGQLDGDIGAKLTTKTIELEEKINNINIPVKSVNEKIGDVVLKATDIKANNNKTVEQILNGITANWGIENIVITSTAPTANTAKEKILYLIYE